MLETFDHPLFLDKALREAQRQLVIVSPWMKSRVVDDAFVGRLRNLLRNGVDVYVGYGFGETESQDDSDCRKALTGWLKSTRTSCFGDSEIPTPRS